MAPRTVMFKCLFCGHEYEGTFDPQNVTERTCPKCRSNSVRRLPPAKKTEK
jgi:DNA-directed RNA polymerase subunit RPC12/RpoP